MPKFGTKMPDLGIFDQKCLIWVFLGYNFNRTITIFVISNPWNCLIAKCYERMKMPKFGIKSALFDWFWAIILQNYWNQNPQICQKWVFNEEWIVNFGIGSAFSEGPGSTFCESLGRGPRPLYKVCWLLATFSC